MEIKIDKEELELILNAVTRVAQTVVEVASRMKEETTQSERAG